MFSLDLPRRLEFERRRLWFRLSLLVGPALLLASYGQAVAGIATLITAGILGSSAVIWLLCQHFPELSLRMQLGFRLLDIGLIYLILFNLHQLFGNTDYSFIYILSIIAATSTHGHKGMVLTATVSTLIVLLERVQLAQLGVVTLNVAELTDVAFHAVVFFVVGSYLDLLIAQRNVAENKVRKQSDYLRALVRTAGQINAKVELQDVLNAVCEETAHSLDVPMVTVSLYNPHREELRLAAYYGLPSDFAAKMQPMPKRVYDAYARATPVVVVPDVQALEELPNESIYRQLDVRTTVGTSMYRGETLVGRLNIATVGDVRDFDPEELDLVKGLAGQAALAIARASLFDALKVSNAELSEAYDTTLEGWVTALEFRDHETEGHTQRVAEMAVRLARAMGVDEGALVDVRRGALLHDIGKMAVPDAILNKPGPLTDEEWDVMRQHPVYARDWLEPIAYLKDTLDIPHHHHEKWDGTGYPAGLKGEDIPLAARIFAVVDVWDALSSDRPYRKAWPQDKVLEHIHQQAGTHFDPAVVAAFLDLLKQDQAAA